MAARILGIVLFSLAFAVFVGVAYGPYLDIISWQPAPVDSHLWSYRFIRHVVLVPGFVPLAVLLYLFIMTGTSKSVTLGIVLIPFLLVIHAFVFVISAHDDTWYPFIQLLEIVMAVLIIRLSPKRA